MPPPVPARLADKRLAATGEGTRPTLDATSRAGRCLPSRPLAFTVRGRFGGGTVPGPRPEGLGANGKGQTMDRGKRIRCVVGVFVCLTCVSAVVLPAGEAAGRGKAGPVEVSSPDEGAMDLREKLATLIVPELAMDDMPVMEVFQALRQQSKDLDPARQGVNLLVQCAKGEPQQKISVSLTNVPLGEAIRYVCMASGLSYRIDPAAVT